MFEVMAFVKRQRMRFENSIDVREAKKVFDKQFKGRLDVSSDHANASLEDNDFVNCRTRTLRDFEGRDLVMYDEIVSEPSEKNFTYEAVVLGSDPVAVKAFNEKLGMAFYEIGRARQKHWRNI
ncbi:hypothetical protein HNV12_00355 [Methanococcoides sp. SA1]|nr:hypothetical protein [Methanococcoides sp. SA1]